MHRLFLQRKTVVIILAVLLIGAGMLFIWLFRMRSQEPMHTPSRCSAYGGTFDSIGPESVDTFVNKDSRAIIVADVEDPKALDDALRVGGPVPRIKVKEVLKGTTELRRGDSISICSGVGHVELPKSGPAIILVFLEGKDGDTWVPSYGYYGINAEENGRFLVGGAKESESLTLDELRKIIK